jgi:hypothetical protein
LPLLLVVMALPLILALLVFVLDPVLAAFGVTSTGNAFRVDTAGGLVFDVNKYIDLSSRPYYVSSRICIGTTVT